MKISYPGNDLAFYTAWWMFLGIALVWLRTIKNDFPAYYWILLIHSFLSIGIWLQSRASGYALMFLTGLMAIASFVGQCFFGFSVRRVVAAVFQLGCAFACYYWLQREED